LVPERFRFVRRAVLGAELLAGMLAVVGSTPSRKNEPRPSVDETVGPHTESVLLTRTAPPGPRWIEVSRWEDLVKASRFMGRPILRVEDGTRGVDQPLFYVPDGPQSYVFNFPREGVNTSTSGGYTLPSTLPSPPEAPAVAEPVATPTPVPKPPATPSLVNEPVLPEPSARMGVAPSPPPKEETLPGNDVVERYLGPEMAEPKRTEEFPGKNRVEQEIRGMIHDVLIALRTLSPGSTRMEKGRYHIQRALELLAQGRYGSAQIEVNRAARLVHENPQD
jgi:hypothetical protein